MKEALFYTKLKNKIVQCQLCPKFCTLKPNERGYCNARENQDGKLISLVYGNIASIAIDPVEKKPLYHFFPGTMTYSIGTVGCSMHCLHCQNASLSQSHPEYIPAKTMTPKQVVQQAINNNCPSISYTYSEPMINVEFVLETSKIAKRKGLKNIIVSNGYVNPEPLTKLCPYIDAANIDLKAFTNKFYKEVSDAELEPVLKTLKLIKQKRTWTEITYLVIPTLNDNLQEIEQMCKWIKTNLNKKTPIHFTRFFPMYKLQKLPQTSIDLLRDIKELASKYLDYVYIGNISENINTYCHKCKKPIIERSLYTIKPKLKDSKCPFCSTKIPGKFTQRKRISKKFRVKEIR